MPITVTCRSCGATYALPDSRAGQDGHCKCGATIHVPGPGETPASPPPKPAEPTVECRHCGMQSRPGPKCQWCDEPLRMPHAEEEHSVLLGLSSGRPASAGQRLDRPRYEAAGRGPEAPMPSTVRAIRALLMLGIVLLALGGAGAVLTGLMAGSVAAGEPAGAVAAGVGVGVGALLVTTSVLMIVLWVGLGRASTTAWWIYTVLTGLNVVTAPLRAIEALAGGSAHPELAGFQGSMLAWSFVFTLIPIVILIYWLKPEVKEWYGLG